MSLSFWTNNYAKSYYGRVLMVGEKLAARPSSKTKRIEAVFRQRAITEAAQRDFAGSSDFLGILMGVLCN